MLPGLAVPAATRPNGYQITVNGSHQSMLRISQRRGSVAMKTAGLMSAMAQWIGNLFFPQLRTETNAELYIMEHDNPSDLHRFASRSLLSLQEAESV